MSAAQWERQKAEVHDQECHSIFVQSAATRGLHKREPEKGREKWCVCCGGRLSVRGQEGHRSRRSRAHTTHAEPHTHTAQRTVRVTVAHTHTHTAAAAAAAAATSNECQTRWESHTWAPLSSPSPSSPLTRPMPPGIGVLGGGCISGTHSGGRKSNGSAAATGSSGGAPSPRDRLQ
jgi:hypothetical protein